MCDLCVEFQIIMAFVFTEDLRGETMVSPSKKLDDLIHLAELCVDLLQQNEEHFAEVRTCICYPNIYNSKHITVYTTGRKLLLFFIFNFLHLLIIISVFYFYLDILILLDQSKIPHSINPMLISKL